jgi:Tol biopolymer transport system component
MQLQRRHRLGLACGFGLWIACLGGQAPPAAAQYLFGQNKVIYNNRDWKVVATPRLDVYYYAGEEELAAYVADFAEKTCVEYETYFHHVFKTKIPLILYASHHDFKQTNVIDMMISEYVGGFTEYLRGRVAIPHSGSMTQLRNVTRHELVHAFMNDKLAAMMSAKKRFNLAPPPLWFSEGLAEYVATPSPDTEARMFVRDLVVNDNLVPYEDLWRIAGSFLMYKEGESLVRYIATTYGDEALVRLLDNWWAGNTFESVVQFTLGLPIHELDRDWQRALKRRYYPAVMANQWPEQTGIALTHRPGINTRPAIEGADPDAAGKVDFVFLSSQGGTIDLLRATPATAAARTGTHMAATNFETLVRGGRGEEFESFPAFSSGPEVHDRRVAFTCKAGGHDALVLWDLDKNREERRFRFERLVSLSTPTWSPQGDAIVFSALDAAGWPDLYRLQLATGDLQRLTHDLADDRDPDWSHDGKRIAWSSDRDARDENGVYHIWVLDLADGGMTPITGGNHEDTAPSWSPDDRSLLFGSDADGQNNIYLYEFEAQRLSQVTASLGGIFTPQWLPDGGGFLATTFANTSYNIFQFPLERRRDVPEPIPAVQLAEATTQPAASGTDAGDWIGMGRLAHFPSRDYHVKFGLDFIRTAVAYDPDFTSAVGGQLGFTDMLGNHQLSIYAANSSNTVDEFFRHLNLGVTYTNLGHRLNYSVGLFHLTSTYDARADRFRWERRYGGLVGVSLPLSRFRRIETSMVVRGADLDAEDANLLGVGQHGILLSNFTSFVHDNTIWSSTGPMDGTRMNITLGHTFDLNGSRRGGSSAQIDLRRYVPLPSRTVLAGRLAARGSWGPDVQYFFLGGPFDLRGYRLRSLFARRVAFANGEIRFPLLDRLLLGLPFTNFELGGFRAAVFGDGAYVGTPYSDFYGSFGVGFEMWLGPGFVARFDVGRTHDFRSLSPETFKRFYLGWDY